jgi:hypothetical protein
VTEQLDDFEIPPTHQKPIRMGEFGAYAQFYGNPAIGDPTVPVQALRDLQVLSCNPAYDFVGWLLWTWNTSEQVDQTFNRLLWTALDQGGAISNILSSMTRPNLCLP